MQPGVKRRLKSTLPKLPDTKTKLSAKNGGKSTSIGEQQSSVNRRSNKSFLSAKNSQMTVGSHKSTNRYHLVKVKGEEQKFDVNFTLPTVISSNKKDTESFNVTPLKKAVVTDK